MKGKITFDVPDEKTKEEARREAAMRGESLSAAMQQIFEYGFAIYKEKVPVKFAPVSGVSEMSVKQ